jgi:hypothetical protein
MFAIKSTSSCFWFLNPPPQSASFQPSVIFKPQNVPGDPEKNHEVCGINLSKDYIKLFRYFQRILKNSLARAGVMKFFLTRSGSHSLRNFLAAAELALRLRQEWAQTVLADDSKKLLVH